MDDSAPAEDRVATLATCLRDAESARTPIAPLTSSFPDLTVSDAYRIQRRNIELRLTAGDRLAGHKIGLTAKAMQELFGVDEPDYGHLLESMFHDAHQPLNLRGLIDPQIEVEPAFILSSRLAGPGLTIDDVIAATDHIRVCFEIIDSRIIDWQVKLQDTVADNGSSALVILGDERHDPAGLALHDLETELEVDGRIVETGNTGAILGHPCNGIIWLARYISQFGLALEAGNVVLPGTCTRSYRLAGHRRAVGRIAGLGEIAIDIEGMPAVVKPART
jgi:2-keto-4-pentenoate hydratase